MKINKYIDHTILKRDAVSSEIDKIIKEAIKYKFKTICIHPIWIEYSKDKLKKTDVEITTVLGFPYGTQTTETKVFEAKDALKKGADELDFVINISMVHEHNTDYLNNELKLIRKATQGTVIKLILEIGLLTNDEIKYISELAVAENWNFIKTSTGIQTTGATIEAVELMKSITKNKAEVKASGSIRSFEDAVAMINAGATRIGTSNGVDIMKGKVSKTDY
ncbi:MAG: deoxyribose-phosphate aldolase [Mycoplasmataceae bacterium]|nr:deoxyribose-phosphate aldolase [Mycoplasmataceae bacterium]